MQKQTATPLLVLALSLLGLLLSGCAKSSQEQILGKWQPVGTNDSQIEFFPDGTLVNSSTKTTLQISGKWLILPDGRLKIELTMFGASVTKVLKVQFSGAEMSLTDDQGKVEKLTRVK